MLRVSPLPDETFLGGDVLKWAHVMAFPRAPLHTVYLKCGLDTGLVGVGMGSYLPVKRVSQILKNDIAGEKVFPTPAMTDSVVSE